MGQLGTATVSLHEINVEQFPNIRTNMDPGSLRNLALDIYTHGLIYSPIVTMLPAEGGEGEVPCAAAGFRRIQALKNLEAMISEHNQRLAAGEDGFKDTDDSYPFDRVPGGDPLVFEYDNIEVELCAPEEVQSIQFRENMQREDLNIMDRINAVCGFLAAGTTQNELAQMSNITQGLISQYNTVFTGCISDVHDALREDKIRFRDALAISKLRLENKKPAVREQKAALDKLINKPEKSGVESEKKRSLADLRKLRLSLADEQNYRDADADRRRIIQETLTFLDNPDLTEEVLVYGGGDTPIDITVNMPEPPPEKVVKEKKPPKEKAPKKEKAAKAAKGAKKGTKTATAPAASSAATDTAKAPVAARKIVRAAKPTA
jgi:hypothetical protein